MTISIETRVSGPFVGDGAIVNLDFVFKVFDDTEVVVLSRFLSTGVDTTLSLGVDYTILLNTDQDTAPGGRVTLTSPLAAGRNAFIVSDVNPLQLAVFTNTGGFYPTVLNDSLDRLHALHLENKEVASRAVLTPVGETGNLSLPPVANRAGYYLYFDLAGNLTAAAGTADGPLRADLASTTAGKGASLVVLASGVDIETMTAALVASLATKAGKGANNDIISLSGLTTPLSVGQGGTGLTDITGLLPSPGDVKTGLWSAAPATWLEMNGKSIGNAASGGTSRANADTAALFAVLWALDATVSIIQTSAGGASTRGASAAADYAANKRLSIPDFRGNAPRGWDNGRGVDTARLMGSEQLDALQNITGTTAIISGGQNGSGVFAANGAAVNHISSSLSGTDPSLTFDASRVARTATETRMRNVALMFVIKL